MNEQTARELLSPTTTFLSKFMSRMAETEKRYVGGGGNTQLEIGTSINNKSDTDKLLMRSIKIAEPNSLEKLVKRTTTKSVKKDVQFPMQKNIDLKDPILKKKGIKEKDKKKHDSKDDKKDNKKNDSKDDKKNNKKNEDKQQL
jgi:hypothetical protein